MTNVYKKAFTEVYEILNYLDKDDYNKIPKNIINALKENRDTEYNFFVDESIPFYEQNLLEETKAILFNVYRDYLANSEMKDKIIKFQREEEKISEILMCKEYKYNNVFDKNKVHQVNNNILKSQQINLIKYKNNIFTRIIKRIKILWNSKITKMK